jgi:hypothetical protein
MYCAFVEWCKSKDDLFAYSFPENKRDWFPHIESHFPGFLKWVKEQEGAIEFVEKFKSVYNGDLVSGITNLQGRELGAFMANFKEYMGGKENLMKKVVDNGQEWIKLQVEHYYKQQKQPA